MSHAVVRSTFNAILLALPWRFELLFAGVLIDGDLLQSLLPQSLLPHPTPQLRLLLFYCSRFLFAIPHRFSSICPIPYTSSDVALTLAQSPS